MKRKKMSRFLSVALACTLMVQTVGTDLSTVYGAEETNVSKETVGTTGNNANFDFESGLDGWTVNGDVAVTEDAKSGERAVVLQPNASISMTMTEIDQGSYTLSSWIKGTAGKNANITVKDTGAPDAVLLLDTYLGGDTYTQTGHRNVLVYNGQMTICITAGTTALTLDNLDLALDSKDANSISNWDFEDDLQDWTTTGDVAVDTTQADTGKNAVSLADGSEISQVVSVEPNTRYSVTMRAKVTTPDTFDSEDVYYDGSTTEVEGKLVNRTSLGNRINLGVRGLDGTVLRQAPSATEDYSLISITFTTGSEDTQVEIYANTICDQAYQDSVTLYETEGTKQADEWTGNGEDSVWVDNFDLFSIQDENYVRGADVSFLPIIEDNDGKYFANGVEQDCLRILANHGVNSITSMIFVQAGNPVHDPSSLEVLSNDWYYTADGSTNVTSMVKGGYFDKDHSLELGQRATALGMSYLPSFHYSDYWMSNAKAYTPEEWINKDYEGNLSNTDLAHMHAIVYNYVYDFMKNLADNQVNVAGVKLGNEQNGGLAWPTGKGATTVGHAAIIAASYEAVEDAMPGVSGYVHSNNGYTTSGFTSFFQALLNNGAEFDGTAFSLYGGRSSGNTILMAKQSNSDETMRYMDYVNVETGFSFTKYKAVSAQQTGAMGQSQYYATSGNGQYNWLLDYMQAALDVENPYGQTRGFYYWETDWIPTPGAASSEGGVADICARTMFNNGDVSIKEMGSTQAGKAGDMMDSMYAYLMRGCGKDKADTMQTPLRDAGTYSVDVTDPTGITLSKESLTLAEGETERLQPTITPIDKVLSDSDVTYSSEDPQIASVTEDGFVCARKAGTTTVKASVKGGFSASVTVTVTAAQVASGISMNVNGTVVEKELNATVNDRLQLDATLEGTYDSDVVVYTSSDPEVASFFGETWQTKAGEMRQETEKDSKVQLNVKSVGTTTITVATADGSKQTSVQLTVGKVDAASVTVSKTEASISYNRSVQLNAEVAPQDTTLYKIHWESEDTSIATVDETGLVTGVGIGDTTIRAVSDDNANVYGTCTIHVLQVQAEGITLDKSNMTIQIGSTKAIHALITPDDTFDKSVTWSSANPEIATVNEAGEVTGISEGTTVITAKTAGETYTAQCSLTVQKDAIPVTGVSLSESEYYFASDYFAETNQTEEAPIYRIYATTEPEAATNSEVTFVSDTPSVATVDNYGRITAVSAGVAQITATTVDGNYTATMNVYVPSVSEDYDNLDTGSSYTLSASSAGGGTMAGTVADVDGQNVLQVTGGGSGGRGSMKKFASVIDNDKIVADFDWNVGTPVNSNGAYITLTDSNGNRYLSLQTNNGAELVYSTGEKVTGNTPLSDATAVGTGFNVNGAWYHVHVTIDSAEQKVMFTISSLADPTLTATQEVAFAEGTSYAGDLAAMQFYTTRKSSMSWTTQIDNLNVYAAAPVATDMILNKDSVKLIPIEGTLCTSSQLTAEVVPETAGTGITWTSSDESVATVSQDGLVTAATTYQTLDEIQTGSCVIRATSISNPALYKEIPVVISNSPNASEFFSVKDADGNIVYDTATGGKEVLLDSGDEKQYSPVVTGGDGDTDIANIQWSTDNEEVVSIEEKTGNLIAMGPGTATVRLQVTLYTGEPLIAEIPFRVQGIVLAKTAALEEAITQAKAAKEKEDYYYEAESLATYKEALGQAETDLAAAVSEKWSEEKQSVLDADREALKQAVESLTLLDVINMTDLELSGADKPVSIGKSMTLMAQAAPEGANEELVWTSSNPEVAVVGRNTGKIVPIAEGTVTITATSVSKAVSASKDITVTSDLSSYYEQNGVTITSTNAVRPATYAFDNAQTMNIAGGNNGKNAWTTGSDSKVGQIVADLGQEAEITNVKTAFWSLLKYTIDVSADGENWTTVCDHSQEAAGVLSTAAEPYTDEMPEGTTARFVRLNVLENGGAGWIGVTIMQINGIFSSDTRFVDHCDSVQTQVALGEDITAALPEKITATLQDGTTEETEVTWNAEDIVKAESGNAPGEYVINGTIQVDGITYDVTCSVTVTQLDFNQAELNLEQVSYVYDGTAKTPKVTVNLNDTLLTAENYDVVYTDNTNAGEAKVRVTGKGRYVGTLETTFTITPAELTEADTEWNLGQTSYAYDGTAKTPAVTVSYKGTVLESGNYEVSYKNNTEVGDAAVAITGIGNYTGILEKAFSITKAELTAEDTKVTLNPSSYVYDGKEKRPNVTVSCKGQVLAAENYEVSYRNNKNAGTATVVIKGKGNYTGTVSSSFTIRKASKTITIKKTNIKKIYGNGSFSLGASTAKGERLTYSMSNKNVLKISNGKASIIGCGTVVITVKSAASVNYNKASDKKITVTVVPKTAKLVSVKNSGSKKITLKWSKDSAVSGYEISYATNKSFKSAKKMLIKSNKITTMTISKLTKGKIYYVRIRSYKTVDGDKLYGDYSSVKKVKIKK